MLERVGLQPSKKARYPSEFSGGQLQRLAIARALVMQPQVLICDEPTSALDVSVQAQILQLLSELQRDLGVAVVFISHDLAVVSSIADRVSVMYLGRIVESGAAADVLGDPAHPYTRALVSSEPGHGDLRPMLHGDAPSPLALPTGCRFQTRCPVVQSDCLSKEPVLVPAGSLVCRSPVSGSPVPTTPVGSRAVACWHPLGTA